MKYLSLFSGIGGFEYGIEKAWKSIQGTERRSVQSDGNKSDIKEWSDEQPEAWGDRLIEQPENIGYSEIDKYAIQIYEKHFKHKNYGDATKIIARDLPDFDLLVGGFPCQAFSIAGKRKGFDDTRGTLFFDIARICAEKRPRLVVLENVKGLLSHDRGKTFETIIRVLTDLGYFVEWQVLNSKNFGVPQNRERVFIIGHLGGQPRRKVFPITNNNSKTLSEYTSNQSQGNRVYSSEGVSVTLASQAGGLGAKTGLYAVDLTRRSETNFRIRKDGRAGTLGANYYKGLANQERPGVVQLHTLTEDVRIRRLTPKECERLQGYPDGWTEGLSDTQRYKCLGNAVTTNVITYVFRKLLTTK
jgi:DNA (cytosine-5)-methyltransferase 1